MPIRTLKIENGPGFQGFVISNGIVTELQLHQVFTMDQDHPEGITTIHTDKKVFQMPLKLIGKARGEDSEKYNFISYLNLTFAPKDPSQPSQWFYVGTYNTRTRKGVCEEIDGREFFQSHAMRLLFPNLVPK